MQNLKIGPKTCHSSTPAGRRGAGHTGASLGDRLSSCPAPRATARCSPRPKPGDRNAAPGPGKFEKVLHVLRVRHRDRPLAVKVADAHMELQGEGLRMTPLRLSVGPLKYSRRSGSTRLLRRSASYTLAVGPLSGPWRY